MIMVVNIVAIIFGTKFRFWNQYGLSPKLHLLTLPSPSPYPKVCLEEGNFSSCKSIEFMVGTPLETNVTICMSEYLR